jgi:hypothetical protein
MRAVDYIVSSYLRKLFDTMPSVIPGYEYDIFISYRHNDNRSGWVTSFVSSLKAELQTISKDPVSIYFDAHPVDGLLEMHDVEDSLNEKLHAYIFMPIISQTYCDVKSYAWRNEFLAFNKLASQDPSGFKIKLANGNVISRILPIQNCSSQKSDAFVLLISSFVRQVSTDRYRQSKIAHRRTSIKLITEIRSTKLPTPLNTCLSR